MYLAGVEEFDYIGMIYGHEYILLSHDMPLLVDLYDVILVHAYSIVKFDGKILLTATVSPLSVSVA